MIKTVRTFLHYTCRKTCSSEGKNNEERNIESERMEKEERNQESKKIRRKKKEI